MPDPLALRSQSESPAGAEDERAAFAKSLLVGIWNRIKSVAQSVWNGVRDIIQRAVSGARSAISGFIGFLGGLIGKFHAVVDAARSAFGWIGKVASKAGDVAGGIGGLLSFLPGLCQEPARVRARRPYRAAADDADDAEPRGTGIGL